MVRSTRSTTSTASATAFRSEANVPLELPLHAHAGARALVLLHERHLRRCVATWQRAVLADVGLPETDDECYASLGHLDVHILGAARHCMSWCCEKLELPNPGFLLTPPPGEIAGKASADLEHVLERALRWRTSLPSVLKIESTCPPGRSSSPSTRCSNTP